MGTTPQAPGSPSPKHQGSSFLAYLWGWAKDLAFIGIFVGIALWKGQEPWRDTVSLIKAQLRFVPECKPGETALNCRLPDNTIPPPSEQHRILLAEAFRVIFNEKDVYDRQKYSDYVAALDYGAHYEGILRAVLYGELVKQREFPPKDAPSPAAIKRFVMLWKVISQNHSQTQMLSLNEVRRLKDPVQSLYERTEEKQATKDLSPEAWTTYWENRLVTASVFGLKRALIEYAWERLDDPSQTSLQRARLFAELSVVLAKFQVDLGHSSRMKFEIAEHQEFAQKHPIDRLKLELAVRICRVLNGME